MPRIEISLMLSAVFYVPFATAAPITWTVQTASFPSGGDITGNFTYDATADMYTSVALTITDVGDPFIWNSANISGPLSNNEELDLEAGFGGLDPGLFLDLSFASPLTDAGGVIDTAATVTLCNPHLCEDDGPINTTVTSVDSTPEPSTGSLLLASLLLTSASSVVQVLQRQDARELRHGSTERAE